MPRRKTSVLILHNSPQPAESDQAYCESEAGVLAEVQAVEKALRKRRIAHRTVGVCRFEDVPIVLSASDEMVVFNLVEGFWHETVLANYVPNVVRSFGKACTGNSTLGLLLSLDKWQSKTLLTAAGLPTPKALLIGLGQPVRTRDLFEGPFIVKPAGTDASEGIDRSSVIATAGKSLREAVTRIHQQWHTPALIEQFVDGRELNVSVIRRGGGFEVLPLAEIDFGAFESDRPRIVGYEAKWLADSFEYHNTPRVIPAPLPKRVAEQVRRLAVEACRTLSCFDYCRVDFRLDKANRPYILEVNANPDISPDAGFAAAVQAAGLSYDAFVKLTIDNTIERNKKVEDRKPVLPAARHASSGIEIRWCRPGDRQIVLSFLAETGFFRPDEIEIAREVLDVALADGPEGHYQSFVAIADSEVVGWMCFGPTPCTLGCFDLYWIGVSGAWQGRGIGRALMAFAEHAIAQQGGRLIVIETSSRDVYLPTREFYKALDYRQVAQVPEFYGPSDDRVIFSKTLT